MKNDRIVSRERASEYVIPPLMPVTGATLRIIGGNLQNGVQTIKYVADADFVVTAVYDPATDTVYDDGLGHGYLVLPGQSIVTASLVLIRNNYAGLLDSIMGGNAYLCGGWDTITYSGTVMMVALLGRG